MRSFRVRATLRRPREELWQVMRDHVSEIASRVADIERVVPVKRSVDAEGNVHLTHEWYVRVKLPNVLKSVIGDCPFGWKDQNVWNTSSWTCEWSGAPFFFPGSIQCAGIMRFARALGSAGTRVTFEGDIDIKPGIIAAGPFGGMERPVRALAESIVTTIVPQNVQRVLEAAANFSPVVPTSPL